MVSGIKLVPVIPVVVYHEVPRGYHHRQQNIFRLALRPSCSTILARTSESWHYSSSGSNASRRYSSRPLRAVTLGVLTLPLGGLGCPVLTRHLFMWLDPVTALALLYSTGTMSKALDYLKTNSIDGA